MLLPKKSLSIIIPAYNEKRSVGRLLASLQQLYGSEEIIVVDDFSTDKTAIDAAQKKANVVQHPHNIGNGAAIKTGVRVSGGDVFVFMDADGQHEPTDIEVLLAHMDRYDMVVGARTADQHASWGRRWMNGIYNRLASYVTGFKVEDLTSGFRAVRADTARAMLPLLPNGYSWPTTITLAVLRSGMSVKYVPINARPRKHGKSSIRPLRDGAKFFMIILKICTLYSPFKVFLPVSGLMFLLGLINYAYTYFFQGRFTNMSALMFTSSVIIFMMGLISEQISQLNMLRQQVMPDKSVKIEKPDNAETAGEVE